MDLKWGDFFFKRKWFCWGRGSYRGQIQLDSNWLPCVVSCWSSRGYQNIMPGRVITMTSRVIKDIKSGRWVRREMRKAGRAEEKKDSQEKKKRWKTQGARGRKINTLLYAALRMCPLAAPDSLSKDSNSQQTNWTSIHRPTLIICHPSLSLSPFISVSSHKHIHTHAHMHTLQPTGFSPPNLTL